jgi:CO/xanthine dehydrogenase Mo-binding subunit
MTRRLRVDSPGKILGTTRFTIDITLPGMLTAVVLHPSPQVRRRAGRSR